MSMNIATDCALSPAERMLLKRLAGCLIPPDSGFAVPGADDPAIQQSLLRIVADRAEPIREALTRFAAFAGEVDAALRADELLRTFEEFRSQHVREAMPLISAVLQAYYQDDRIMRSLGMEARPPFPEGFAVPEGDWSLIEPVKKRVPFWRHAPD